MLWREYINIYCPLLELCKFNLVSLFPFRVIVSLLQFIWLIDCHHFCFIIKHLLNFFSIRFLLILILGLLVVYVFLLSLVLTRLNSLLELESVYSLAILTMSKVIGCLTFKHIPLLYQVMLSSMKQFFLFPCLKPFHFTLPLPLYLHSLPFLLFSWWSSFWFSSLNFCVYFFCF